VSAPKGQSRSAQSATMKGLPGVSTEGSPCVVVLEEKFDSGPESADTASGSAGELLTCSEKATAMACVDSVFDSEVVVVAIADPQAGVHEEVLSEMPEVREGVRQLFGGRKGR
jgi:hypothetical protein